MIYFQPIGGLANRLRGIDSAINYAIKYEEKITIIWSKNYELNCSFYELFAPIFIENLDIKVIDCPVDFPQRYIFNGKNSLSYKGNPLLRIAKNVGKGRLLNRELVKIVKVLKTLQQEAILTNRADFDPIYHKLDKENLTVYRELDKKIIEASQVMIKNLLEGRPKAVYISSCYRFAPLDGNYDYLKPRNSILKRIEATSLKYKNTVGLHIRRGDHEVAKKFSDNGMFLKLLDRLIGEEEDISFFICSDDQQTKDLLISKFEDKILYNEISSYDRNSKEAIVEAVVDLYCLSRAKKIFGSHQSSFSQVAADIGNIKEITVK